VAFCLALIFFFAALLRLPRRLQWIRVLGSMMVLLPVTALIVSRLALWLSADLASPQTYAAIKASLWSSLALWEWIGAGSIYLFLCLLTIGLHSASVDSNSSDVSSSK
jgi:hypothetical protein